MKIRTFRNRAGGTLVMVVVCLTALLAFAALSVDLGNVYTHRKYLQEGADAAAMAAVQDWATTKDNTQTIDTGTTCAKLNGMKTNEIVSIIPGVWASSNKTFTAGSTTFASNSVPAVRVIATRAVATPFWQAFTFGSRRAMNPRVQSIAIAGQASAASGILPWAVCNLSTTPNRCDVITVKNGSDCSSPGNFSALNLNSSGGHGGGSSTYSDNIQFGYNGTVHIGDQFYPETGNMVGPTDKALKARINGAPPYNCTSTSPIPNNGRLAILPITTALPNGTSAQVTILGFYVVALSNPSGGGQVDATFLEAFGGTEVDPTVAPIVGMLNGIALVQ